MTRKPQASGRFDTIDLLRGFSILGVVLLHASLWLSFGDVQVGAGLPKWLRYVLFSQGGNGVSLFFAISGFLITWTSIQRFGSLQRLAPARFYRIRFARIAPMLLLLLAVLSVLHLAHVEHFRIKPKVGSLPHALFAALTFQLNWYEAVHGWLPAVWTVLWSLSVEEVFYLVFPLACFALLRVRWTRALYPLMLLALVAFGPFARTPWYTANDIWLYQSYWGNVDNIALGCLFAMLAHRLLSKEGFCRSRWPALLQSIGALLLLFIVFWDWPKVIALPRALRHRRHGPRSGHVPGHAGQRAAAPAREPMDRAATLAGTPKLRGVLGARVCGDRRSHTVLPVASSRPALGVDLRR